MKKGMISFLAICIAFAGMLAFTSVQTGTIKGMVTPAEGGAKAWALSATDTLQTDITDGKFELTGVNPGTYQVIIEAKPPFKNQAKDNVIVADGQTADVGEIKLAQ